MSTPTLAQVAQELRESAGNACSTYRDDGMGLCSRCAWTEASHHDERIASAIDAHLAKEAGEQVAVCAWCDKPVMSTDGWQRRPDGSIRHMDPCAVLYVEERLRALLEGLKKLEQGWRRMVAEEDPK